MARRARQFLGAPCAPVFWRTLRADFWVHFACHSGVLCALRLAWFMYLAAGLCVHAFLLSMRGCVYVCVCAPYLGKCTTLASVLFVMAHGRSSIGSGCGSTQRRSPLAWYVAATRSLRGGWVLCSTRGWSWWWWWCWCWWYIWFLIGSARALFHYIRASLGPPGVGSFFCCAGQALFWERFSVLLNGAWEFIHSWRHDSGDMCGVVRLP